MEKYFQKVNMRSRKAMVDFLKNHFRYDTMNSWNASTSYANNVKIYNLPLTHEQRDKLYQLIEAEDFYDDINCLMRDFDIAHDYRWQVGFNGRSSGYIVLYQGYSKLSEYKSFCTACGQRNFRTVEETGGCVCGRCRKETRVNYVTPPMEHGSYPGRSIDMGEDFEDWDISDIRERVSLVCDLDKLCDDIVDCVKNMIDTCITEDETEYVPVTKKMLVRQEL